LLPGRRLRDEQHCSAEKTRHPQRGRPEKIRQDENASSRELLQAIHISLQLEIETKNAGRHHRLNAGRMLLELRHQVEAEGADWWQWQKGHFSRSRKDLEKLMRLASADETEAAIEEYWQKDAEQRRKARAKNGADVCSNPIERILKSVRALAKQPAEPKPEIKTVTLPAEAPAPAPAPKPRDGLADLRAAAQRRKQATA
jgi:hypothetical protein